MGIHPGVGRWCPTARTTEHGVTCGNCSVTCSNQDPGGCGNPFVTDGDLVDR